MIKKYSLMALEKAINHALSLDESMPDKISALHGRVLEIIISPLNTFFFIQFENTSLKLLPVYEQDPDTVIHSSPLGLIRLSLLPASKVRSLFNDQINISGDVALGQQVKALFDELDIDWEGHLALFTGDVVAHQIGSLVKEGQSFAKRLSTSFRRHVSEYVQEEKRLTPSAEELHDFLNDVDDLSLRADRLQAYFQTFLFNQSRSS